MQVSGVHTHIHMLSLVRLMLRTDEHNFRMSLLQLLQDANETASELFIDYHGLNVLWSWMVDLPNDKDGHTQKLAVS